MTIERTFRYELLLNPEDNTLVIHSNEPRIVIGNCKSANEAREKFADAIRGYYKAFPEELTVLLTMNEIIVDIDTNNGKETLV